MAKKSLSKQTQTLDAHSTLSDRPTINEGLTATELKTRFDRDVNRNKDYLNDTLTVELADETASNSGSNTIGHNSTSITANNVGDALEENRVAIDALEVSDTNNVKLTGNQTIAGTKTFSSNVVVPTTPTLSTHATSKEYVDNQAPLTIPNNSITNLKMSTDVKIGSLAALDTLDKDSVTDAINETYSVSKNIKLGGGYVINGNFDVWQRGNTFNNPSSGDYLCDRFYISISGGTSSGTFSVSKQKIDSSNPSTPNSNFYFRHNQTVIGDRTDLRYITAIKDLPLYIDETEITASFYLRSSTTLSFNFNFRTNFGTGGSPSSDQQDGFAVNYTNVNNWEKITINYTPDYNGKTFGTDNNSKLLLSIQEIEEINNNVCTFDLSKIKLEFGNVATNFVPKTYEQELIECQHYYQKITSSVEVYTGSRSAANVVVSTVPLPVSMVQTPTATSANTFILRGGGVQFTDLTILDTLSNANRGLVSIRFNSPSHDPVATNSYNVYNNGTTTIELDAEI